MAFFIITPFAICAFRSFLSSLLLHFLRHFSIISFFSLFFSFFIIIFIIITLLRFTPFSPCLFRWCCDAYYFTPLRRHYLRFSLLTPHYYVRHIFFWYYIYYYYFIIVSLHLRRLISLRYAFICLFSVWLFLMMPRFDISIRWWLRQRFFDWRWLFVAIDYFLICCHFVHFDTL